MYDSLTLRYTATETGLTTVVEIEVVGMAKVKRSCGKIPSH